MDPDIQGGEGVPDGSDMLMMTAIVMVIAKLAQGRDVVFGAEHGFVTHDQGWKATVRSIAAKAPIKYPYSKSENKEYVRVGRSRRKSGVEPS